MNMDEYSFPRRPKDLRAYHKRISELTNLLMEYSGIADKNSGEALCTLSDIMIGLISLNHTDLLHLKKGSAKSDPEFEKFRVMVQALNKREKREGVY